MTYHKYHVLNMARMALPPRRFPNVWRLPLLPILVRWQRFFSGDICYSDFTIRWFLVICCDLWWYMTYQLRYHGTCSHFERPQICKHCGQIPWPPLCISSWLEPVLETSPTGWQRLKVTLAGNIRKSWANQSHQSLAKNQHFDTFLPINPSHTAGRYRL